MDLPSLANLALQKIGTRTTVTQAELNAQSTNEAIQFMLAYAQVRDELLRLAPWQCSKGMTVLQYITSLPGTNENQSQQNAQYNWTPGLPLPPWSYEYAYPVDCLRALWIVPQYNSAVLGTPVYPTNTYTGYAALWGGPPIKFDVSQDQFYPVTAATVANGGSGFAVGDIITLAIAPPSSIPIGIPAVLQVTGASGGVITSVAIVPSVYGEDTPQTGGYFIPQSNPQAMASSTRNSAAGPGTGATFNLTYGIQGQQRVILTNQEYAVLSYVRRVTDPNVWDSQFTRALYHIIGAVMTMALTGDKGLANSLIQIGNAAIQEARSTDANEALTTNDVTPDWLRVRGSVYSDYWQGGFGYDWGTIGFWAGY